jgi:malonyl-CoA/methylmalonyl-CoA synthetase
MIGLAPGDRLAAQVEKSPQALALYAACAQAGVVFLPLNTAYTVDELSLLHREQRRGACGLRRAPGSTQPWRRSPKRLGARLETLNADGSGIACGPRRGPCRRSFDTVDRDGRTTWPPFSIPPAPRGARRARC